MIRLLAKSVREYKKPAILTLIFIIGEVFIEVLIPSITAELVNNINSGAPISEVIKTGLTLIAMAIVSLGCGSIAALTCARAAAGFARNLRHDMFSKIQSFSFKNIDKLVKGRVTREVKKGLRELASRIETTSRTSDGNIRFVSGVGDDHESYSKDWVLDV